MQDVQFITQGIQMTINDRLGMVGEGERKGILEQVKGYELGFDS